MANTLATPSWVTKEVARYFVNNLVFARNCNRTYSDQYVQAGAKVGNSVNVRLPQRFQATRGQALQLQNLYDSTVPVTLTAQLNVAFGYSSAQATTELDNIRERYIQPAAEVLANAADVEAFGLVYRDIYNAVGTPGTPISSTLDYLKAGVKLTDLAAPEDGRVAVLDPYAMINVANSASTLFNPSAKISEAFEKGQFGRDVLGVSEWYQSANRPAFTTGTFTASTPLVDTANQTGSTININGWASGGTSLKKGDIITIAGVYSVNPLSYQSTGRLQQFVITADTSDAAGVTATLPISPSIITSGALQTVSNSPADDAVVTVWSANPAGGTLSTVVSPQGMLFHPDAFAFVSADLVQPNAGARSTVVRSKEWGISIRMVEQFQIATDQNPSRLDFLMGAATVQARLACRLVG